MKSKPASPNSPAGGPATDAVASATKRDASDSASASPRASHPPTVIQLEASRQRLISWAILGTVFGALLVWKLGTVGVWVGWVLIALGIFRAYLLAMTLIYPAGTIEVSGHRVVLPRAIHRPKPLEVAPAAVTAVYFLRRSVPWNRAAPVLVVELGSRALLFPRDWFASEADQRHVVHALLDQRPSQPEPEPSA